VRALPGARSRGRREELGGSKKEIDAEFAEVGSIGGEGQRAEGKLRRKCGGEGSIGGEGRRAEGKLRRICGGKMIHPEMQ
jgi:hypothetical protein